MTKALLLKGAAVLVTAVVAAGVAFVLTDDSGAGAAGAGPAQAWVDDPLDGVMVPPGPIPIVAHAYDPLGVTEIVLSVDGVETAVVTPIGAGQVLVFAEWSWVAVDDGVYVLEVVGRNPEGSPGVPSRVTITVGLVGEPEPPELEATTTTTTLLPSTTTTSTLPLVTTTTTAVTTTRPPTTTSPPTTTPTTAPPTTTPPTTTPPTTAPPPCSPPAPLLISPSNNVQFPGPQPSIALRWSGWRGTPPDCLASGFYVEVATNSSFNPTTATGHFGESTTEWTPPPTSWSCNTTHYWRVWSKRSDGSLSAPSSTWQLDVVCVT